METNTCHKHGQTLDRAQNKGGITILRDTQNWAGYSPEHPALMGQLLAGD